MPRAIAQQVLETIEAEDAYSHIALDAALARSALDPRDRALATELVYGTLTWQRALDTLLGEFLRKGTQALDRPVRVALRVAAYQLVFLDRIPAHAAVNEAVNIVKQSPARRASGLVNGVLRNLLRKEKPWTWWRDKDRQKKPARYLGQRYSMPNWLANRLLQRWGIDRAEALAESYTGRAALYLRATSANPAPEKWPEVEAAQDKNGREIPGAFIAASFDESLRAGINAGEWVVQDLGSQLISFFCGVEPGDRVLDGCAGLGGKSLHLAELVGAEGRVVALDPVKSKLDLLKESADLLGLSARVELVAGDLQAFALAEDAAGEERGLFDLVLVDAPCSGLGVIRRHPETRWRRKPADIKALTSLQAELLRAAARLVAPGGALVYSVCTFSREEGPGQVQNFLADHAEFSPAPLTEEPGSAGVDWSQYLMESDGGDALRFQLSLNPLDHGTDGFYAARLKRAQ